MEKIISFKQVYNEAIDLDAAKRYSRLNWNRTKYDSWFGKGRWRLYLPVTSTDALEADIRTVLEPSGFKVKDFDKNLATDKYNREVKITKVLSKVNQGLLQKYSAKLDKSQTASGSEYMIVISRHPYDIAGMSTDRDWKSCMELDKHSGCEVGGWSSNIIGYIKLNALVAYLIKPEDKNINKPYGRIIIYPYIDPSSGKAFLVPSDKVYGTSIPQFPKIVQTWLDRHQGQVDPGIYQANFYHDNMPKEIINSPDEKMIRRFLLMNNMIKNNDPKVTDNLVENKNHWFVIGLLNNKIQVENFYGEINNNSLVWENGTWIEGTWHNGNWYNGLWKKGTWKGGAWDDGVWHNGVWDWGVWKNGIWKGGSWVKGFFKGNIHTDPPNKWEK